MSEELINKYRPQTFDEVLGQDAVVKGLRGVLKKGTTKTFLFTGPSGTGKTTLARIVAKEAGCAPADRAEVDAASNTGIDNMREVTETLRYRPLGEGAIKAVIVDEIQALSKAAFQSLLKALEEPPSWAFWALCTTEPTRVPANILTRCTRFDLKPVLAPLLEELLDLIAEEEGFKVKGNVIALCAAEAGGSPRQAISNLAACSEATIEEARQLLRSAAENQQAIDLARALTKGAPWREVQKILAGLTEISPESVRHVVRAYVSKVALSSNNAGPLIEVLDAFSEPFYQSDGISPLVLACGRIAFAERG